VLLDLNGHTLGGGLALLAHRPAPVQVSFLGSAATSAVPAVSHFVADPRAVPPERGLKEFAEKMVLFANRPFFANDYAVSHALVRNARRAAPPPSVPSGALVLAVWSGWAKVSPRALTAWAQIMRANPRSILWLLQHRGHAQAYPRVVAELAARGVPPLRVVCTPLAPWLDHVRRKTAVDLVLDTDLKNGHTSTADALWAGSPLLTMPGERMQARVAHSLLHGTSPQRVSSRLTRPLLSTDSVREYVDVGRTVVSSQRLRERLREWAAAGRDEGTLFDTQGYANDFIRAMRALIDAPTGTHVVI
jgi:predicted O-linked N-acetylglucosamine transferase (SPINDLY family)